MGGAVGVAHLHEAAPGVAGEDPGDDPLHRLLLALAEEGRDEPATRQRHVGAAVEPLGQVVDRPDTPLAVDQQGGLSRASSRPDRAGHPRALDNSHPHIVAGRGGLDMICPGGSAWSLPTVSDKCLSGVESGRSRKDPDRLVRLRGGAAPARNQQTESDGLGLPSPKSGRSFSPRKVPLSASTPQSQPCRLKEAMPPK